MAKERFILFKNEIRDFSSKGCESKAAFAKDEFIVAESDVPADDMADRNRMAREDSISKPGEC
jgi:hypothetical protein